MDREHAAAILGAPTASTPYGLDARALAIRDRLHPEYADAITITRGVVCHRIAPSLLPVVVRRHRLRANGLVEVVANPDPERAGISRMAQALRNLEG